MTDETRGQLACLAARLEAARAEAALKQGAVAHGRLSRNTVSRILHGKNHRLSTLFELVDALGCEVRIEISRKSA